MVFIVVRGRSLCNFQVRKEIFLLGFSVGLWGQIFVEIGQGIVVQVVVFNKLLYDVRFCILSLDGYVFRGVFIFIVLK